MSLIKLKKEAGFSLVEVMVVLAIVSVAACVALPIFSGYLNKAKASEGLSLIAPVKLAVTSFALEHGSLDQISSNKDLDLAQDIHGTYVESIKILKAGVIEVLYKNQLGTLLFTPVFQAGQITWDCLGGTLDPSHRPSVCKA